MGVTGALAYKKLGTATDVENASPHRLIQMLLEGAIEKVNRSKYFIKKSMVAEKGEHISWAISIIGGLQGSLDKEKGGEIANTLNELYDYCTAQLAIANIQNSTEELDKVLSVLSEIKEGWDGIKEQAEAQ
ncbi:flagellar export chaperone FliS [Pleionea litopenaei]|uniref:Flagellar secretion chaperone FliS n=1 Tax=Pleionea litopenaei TaxID=3070815 RepID=A0AA51X6Z5_9GAMM|nr:flagellar export chaperone FliS [Pleionea sp. HL-JVS1]WMS87653.1 flagellar export chaperone FliS [Pleionea sp. HL-JVS1]